jgi:MoaA/NifB/PqqE/SkfB family radical SAM enzyme
MTTAGPTPILRRAPAEPWRAYAPDAPAPWPGAARYRPRAGDPDLVRLAAEADALVARVAPSLAPPRRGAREWSRRARSYLTAAASYRENRRRARAGRDDLLPLYFIWTTLRPCNFRCSYCDDHRGARYPELDGHGRLDTARGRRLLEVMRTRAPSVYFAGGEPTLRKDLPVLARAARDLDYYPIVVNTNGSLLHRLLVQPAWRTFLADLDIVVVSLDALDLGLLAGMWRTPHPEDVLRNLLALRALAASQRFKLMVNCVIQPGLVAEARAVLDLADDLGIWFCPVPRNVGPRIDPALLADPAYPAFVADLLARQRAGARIVGSARMNHRLLTAAPLDCHNTLKPHVDHDGRLAWPCKASVQVDPEWIDVLAHDHVDAIWAEGVRRRDPTGFHGPGPQQCGGDCNWAQNYTTDEYAHGLDHPLHLIGTVARFLGGER